LAHTTTSKLLLFAAVKHICRRWQHWVRRTHRICWHCNKQTAYRTKLVAAVNYMCRRWQDWVGFSAAPQLAPIISRTLQCSQELLDLGTCLPAALARRLLVLHNAAAAPLQFVWDLGVFEEERGAISGRLAIVPATGAAGHNIADVCRSVAAIQSAS
jgi:hypothetical protein